MQEQAQAQAAEAEEKPSSGSKLTLSAPKALLAEMPRPKKWSGSARDPCGSFLCGGLIACIREPIWISLFRTDDVDGMILSRLSDKEKKRQEVIFELIQTERDYLRDLDYVIEVLQRSCNAYAVLTADVDTAPAHLCDGPVSQSYLIPIRERKILTAKDTMVIFSIVEMLVPVNQVRG